MLDIAEWPSPNHDARPAGSAVSILLLHYTGMKTGEAALARLCDPAAKVSAHYVVEEDGRIARLVAEDRRAWHAGVGRWADETDINGCSIGIEIVNPGHEFGYRDFPAAQIEAVIALSRDLVARHGIAPPRVLGHSDVAPERKMDPGELFPWRRLAAAGVGLWVPPEPLTDGPALERGDGGGAVMELQEGLADYGYGLAATGTFDERTEAVVRAFQRHFRPARVDSVADASTLATLRRLLAARGST